MTHPFEHSGAKPDPIAVVLVRDETPKPPSKVREVVSTTRGVTLFDHGDGQPQIHHILRHNPNRKRALVTVQANANVFLCSSRAEALSCSTGLAGNGPVGMILPSPGSYEIASTTDAFIATAVGTVGLVGVLVETEDRRQ